MGLIIVEILLLMFFGLLTALETALGAVNQVRLHERAEEDDQKAVRLLPLVEEPTVHLTALRIVRFLTAVAAAIPFYYLFLWGLSHVKALHLPDAVVIAVLAILTVLLAIFLFLLFGELVPRKLALRRAEKVCDRYLWLIVFLSVLFRPMAALLSACTNGLSRLFGMDPEASDKPVSEDDIVTMLDAGAEEGTLSADNIEYIKNVFELDHLTAADVMTPRNALELLAADVTDEEILEVIETSGYSRLPVYKDTVDNIVGILHIRDYLLARTKPGFTLESVLTEPTFVPETIHLDALFKSMQKQHDHMVVVVDEYGGTAGVVTMEDVLEELVGEIWDEQDEEINNFEKTGENEYRILSVTPLDEFFDFFDLPAEDCESATVNGWVTEHSGSIPEVGFTFDYENLTVTVTKADDLHTEEITVTVRQ